LFRGVYLLFIVLVLLPDCRVAHAAEGVWISAIHVTGLKRTRLRTVLRELPFTTGDQWKADSGAEGERRLRNIGLFSTVVILPPASDGQVQIRVKERWSLFVLPEGSRSDTGKSSAGVTLTEHNLWGLHHQLRIATREDTGKNFSSINGTRADGSYLWRRVADGPVSLGFGLGGGRSVYDVYDKGMLTGQYKQQGSNWYANVDWALGEVPGDGWDLGLGFNSNRSTYKLVSGMPSFTLHNSRRNSMLGSISYTHVDDHTTWLTGVAFQYSLDVAHHALGSTIDVYRQSASIATHVPLSPSSTSTLNLRLNAGSAYGQVLQDGLFDIGFNRGLRGYFPGELQGRFYLYTNIEGRFPLPRYSNFQLVAFSDIGQIWNSRRPAYGNAIVAGIGGGARFTLRWLVNGTFRADAAYGSGSKRWRFYFGTGQTF